LIKFVAIHFEVVSFAEAACQKVFMNLDVAAFSLLYLTLYTKPVIPVRENQDSEEMDRLPNNQNNRYHHI
jgi:hypothetical protein